MIRIMGLLITCALLTPEAMARGGAPASAEDAPKAKRPRKGTRKSAEIYVLGSSSIGGRLGRDVAKLFSERGHSVYRFARRSTGFARPDFFDWWAEVDRMPGLGTARGVVFYMGVNDVFTVWLRPDEREGGRKGPKWVSASDARWPEVYRDRVASLVQKVCDMGASKVALLTPMDVVDNFRQHRLESIRTAQAEAMAQTTCGVAIATDGDIDAIRKGDKKRNALRTADGSHATRKGTRIIMDRVRDPLLAALLDVQTTHEVEPPSPSQRDLESPTPEGEARPVDSAQAPVAAHTVEASPLPAKQPVEAKPVWDDEDLPQPAPVTEKVEK
ncbi:MAG: hypothetical protein ACE366_21390 [Bradymonadia bacterium]